MHDSTGRQLGPREASAMRILWRDPQRHESVREVSQALDADLAYTTVMTLLTRLHQGVSPAPPGRPRLDLPARRVAQ